MKCTIQFALILSIASLLDGCANNDPQNRKDPLAGFYRIHAIEAKDSSGQWHAENIMMGGDGYILYDGNGHMFVQLVGKRYGDFPWLSEENSLNPDSLRRMIDSMNTDELRTALTQFVSNYAYEGYYAIDETARVVQHQRLLNTIPAAWNTTVKRKFSFSGDTLILEPIDANRRLKWVRITQNATP